jgi:hypothetical protein
MRVAFARASGVLALLLGCRVPVPAPSPERAGERVAPHPIATAPPPLRTYLAHRARVAPRIDGVLNDPAWRAAAPSARFVDIEGPRRPAPPLETRVRLAWDDSCLYIGAQLEEPDLWATLTARDAVIFQDHDFEVFLDPDGDTHDYVEIEVNARGAVWDLRLDRPYRDGGQARTAWDAAGLRAAVRLDGTLNDPSDRDRGWSVELAIPWGALSVATPRSGERWRVNFSRVEWALDTAGGGYRKRIDPLTGRPRPESNWVWSPQYAVNMHLPELWGIVQFGGSAVSQDRDEARARWGLRRVYYAQREYGARHGRPASQLDRLGLSDLPRGISLRDSSDGWIGTVPAVGGGVWTIRPDGRIRKER